MIFALNALVVNKLRTILSLLGITIGIFAIIAVFTMVDSMKSSIKDSISSLGDNVIFLEKWPIIFSDNYPWWKYINRPLPNVEEMEAISQLCRSAEAAAYTVEFTRTLSYKNNSITGTRVNAATHQYDQVRNFEIDRGRYFTEIEDNNGAAVVVVGADVAENLFVNEDPLGKTIKIQGKKAEVIGVFKREGESLIGYTTDRIALVPYHFGKSMVNMKSRWISPKIMIRAKEGVSNKALRDELTGIMRSVRRLSPAEESDFAMNETSILSQGLDSLFGVLNIAGGIIGIFSILVGGFSIANIMFVSVKERTPIIGIQKSLGAKNFFILFQFLSEAIILCVIGGSIGLLIIWGLTLVAQFGFDIELALTLGNILIGLGISVAIGLIAGIVPAWSASRLDPVEAIRAN